MGWMNCADDVMPISNEDSSDELYIAFRRMPDHTHQLSQTDARRISAPEPETAWKGKGCARAAEHTSQVCFFPLALSPQSFMFCPLFLEPQQSVCAVSHVFMEFLSVEAHHHVPCWMSLLGESTAASVTKSIPSNLT